MKIVSPNEKPMKLDADKYLYVGCFPVHACPDHPTDQSPCIQVDCPHCKRPMWYSENKRNLKKLLPKRVKVYCLECLAVGAYAQGLDPTMIDISKPNGS